MSTELVERLRASIVVTSEGKGLRMSLSADDVEAAADQLTALTAERDEALRKSEERWQVAIAMADDYNTLMAKVALLIEALRQARIWHESEDKSLSKQPPSHGPNGNQWSRLQHQEQMAEIDAALSEPDKNET